jgi:hypothetical protein
MKAPARAGGRRSPSGAAPQVRAKKNRLRLELSRATPDIYGAAS